ncbi:hypothetical protein NL676_029838 [Syzygium grande]|nr:hypothetical protein NL676_029838 [Syzygium grande]
MMQGTSTISPIRILLRGETLLVAPNEGFPHANVDPNGGVAQQTVIDENLRGGHQVSQVQGPPMIQVNPPPIVLDVQNPAAPLLKGPEQL